MSAIITFRRVLLLPSHSPRPPSRLRHSTRVRPSAPPAATTLSTSSPSSIFSLSLILLFLLLLSSPSIVFSSSLSASSSAPLPSSGSATVVSSFNATTYGGLSPPTSEAVRIVVGFDNNTLPPPWRPILLMNSSFYEYNLRNFTFRLNFDFIAALVAQFTNAAQLSFQVMELQLDPDATTHFYLYYNVRLNTSTPAAPASHTTSSPNATTLSTALSAYAQLNIQYEENGSALHHGVLSRYMTSFGLYCFSLKSFADTCPSPSSFTTTAYPGEAPSFLTPDSQPFTQQPAFLAILFSIIGCFLLMSVCFTVWKCARARRLLGVRVDGEMMRRREEERTRKKARKGAIQMVEITAVRVDDEMEDDEKNDEKTEGFMNGEKQMEMAKMGKDKEKDRDIASISESTNASRMQMLEERKLKDDTDL